ncbi:transposase [Paraburkholderia terrae]|uniref:IS66-like element accessory protein TnpA n=1 Tax=Paraburkholderia terrae TaxID=311230 RepID=UPI0030E36998
MTEHSNDLKSRLVTGFERDGRRRRFDPQAKLELVQVCLKPGVSVARIALEHAVNANLLRKWIRDYERERSGSATGHTIEGEARAFVPVVQIGAVGASVSNGRRRPTRMEIAQSRDCISWPSQLVAELPNGVTLKLGCNERDVALMSAMIETLVRCHVPV